LNAYLARKMDGGELESNFVEHQHNLLVEKRKESLVPKQKRSREPEPTEEEIVSEKTNKH